MAVGVILNVGTAILCLVIPESPRYLFGKERFDQCRESLVIIARRNGIKDFKPPRFEKEDEVLFEVDDVDVINDL